MTAKQPVRRSQLISTFGVGAMIDFPRDESLMTAGLDAWPFAQQRCPDEWLVIEERLQARLGVDHFRLPPDYREPGPGIRNANQKIPFVRFPRWHYCPRDGAMRYLGLLGGSRERCPGLHGSRCENLASAKRPFLIPVRIVAACERGHIQDFPFMEWVHGGQVPAGDHNLKYVAGRSSASLAGIRIECSCKRSRSLAGSFDFDAARGGALRQIGMDCAGYRPWLGESDGEAAHAPPSICGGFLRVLQRGASNVYFSHTLSSIYLPLWAEGANSDIIQALESPEVWDTLSQGLDDGVRISRERCEIVARLRHLDVEELLDAAQKRLDGASTQAVPESEEEFRRHEYDAFLEGRGDPNSDLLVEVREGADYSDPLARLVRRICLVRKLKETRVLAGFSRVFPPGTDEPEDAAAPRRGQVQIQQLSVSARLGWLPATVVRGEGIFLEFDQAALDEWLSKGQQATRIEAMVRRYNAGRVQRLAPVRFLPPKFVLLHTLAHVLIRQLSFDCGYGSASLRERIYCETSATSEPMHGILIYTASGDAEGTMGGLVRQGEPGRLEVTLAEALRVAAWCSSDPVCLESAGQGTDNANLAACHGCVLVSETSCEEGNRLLDRATLVGSIENPQSGVVSTVLDQ